MCNYWKGNRQIFPRVIWLHMYYEKNITGKLSPVHTFAITCLTSLLVDIGNEYMCFIF